MPVCIIILSCGRLLQISLALGDVKVNEGTVQAIDPQLK